MEEQSSDLVYREGPRIIDYLIDFFIYLKKTTGFRKDHFRAPEELRRTFEKMEFFKIPRKIWMAILNAAMKLVAEFQCVENLDELISLIVTVIICLVEYLLKKFFLRAALFLLSKVASPVLSTIIVCIYHFVTWAMIPLLNYIKPKVEEYAKFVLKELSKFFKPRI
ncbi:uncharacterized protein LOC141526687 [Cotesia typhae]|uniref:uncharacterized protein LOC141526687 n=1 Tax=Cotesia typhae TaxID=2053667 RepID=UPI003D696723